MSHREDAMMKDKICVVTGVTSGIGKTAAWGLAKLGATVVIHGRNPERGEAALAEVKAESGNQPVDLTSPAPISLLSSGG